MKQGKKQGKLQELEKRLVTLEDISVLNALLIMVLSLVFLIDIARYQWIMVIILVLGILLNVTLVLCGFLRKQWIVCGINTVMTLGYIGTLIYMLLL